MLHYQRVTGISMGYDGERMRMWGEYFTPGCHQAWLGNFRIKERCSWESHLTKRAIFRQAMFDDGRVSNYTVYIASIMNMIGVLHLWMLFRNQFIMFFYPLVNTILIYPNYLWKMTLNIDSWFTYYILSWWFLMAKCWGWVKLWI